MRGASKENGERIPESINIVITTYGAIHQGTMVGRHGHKGT